MLKLTNGPAKGKHLCERAPYYLRAVQDKAGEYFLLDGLDDSVDFDEKIVAVYEWVDRDSPTMEHFKPDYDKGIYGTEGFYPSKAYALVEPQPDLEPLSDTHTWRTWAADNKPTWVGMPVVTEEPTDGD